MNGKHIKTKKNLKLIYKYLSPLKILETVGKQVYKLKLPSKWHIYLIFQVTLLEKDIIRKEMVDLKIADKLEFKERE